MEPRDALKNISLFRDAAPAEIAAVAAIAEAKAYMVGEQLYAVGDAADAFFIIESGTVDVTLKDKEVPMGSVGAGQALGELAYFDREPRMASAITREPTHVLVVSFAKLDEVFAAHPNLALTFYRRACVFATRLVREMAPDVNRRYL